MGIAIQTLGTRGDVQPYVALAKGLVGRGHDVQISALMQFETFVNEQSIAFVGLPGEFLALLDSRRQGSDWRWCAGSDQRTARGLSIEKPCPPKA